MNMLKKAASFVEKIFSAATAICFAAVSVCVVIQILARYIPGLSAPWSDELSRLLFFYCLMFGAPLAFAHNEYAFIDVIIGNLHGRARHILNTMIYALIAVADAIIAVNSQKFYFVGTKTVSTAMGLQMTWFYGPIIMIFAFSVVGAGVVAIRELIYAVKGEE